MYWCVPHIYCGIYAGQFTDDYRETTWYPLNSWQVLYDKMVYRSSRGKHDEELPEANLLPALGSLKWFLILCVRLFELFGM